MTGVLGAMLMLGGTTTKYYIGSATTTASGQAGSIAAGADGGCAFYKSGIAFFVSAAGALTSQRAPVAATTSQIGTSGLLSGSGIYTYPTFDKIVAINSAGTVSFTSTNSTNSSAISLSGSSNFYVSSRSATGNNIIWNKLNASTGAKVVGRQLALTTSTVFDVVVDSTDTYIYTGGCGGSALYIAKWNTAGTLQWQKTVSGTGATSTTAKIALDGSGNLYIVDVSVTSGATISKLDSTGTQVWQKRFATSNAFAAVTLAVDTSGNAYIGARNSTTAQPAQILKYNTSGTLLWQRTLTSSSYTTSVGVNSMVATDSALYMTIGGSSATTIGYVLKLPVDGSLTGTYTVGANTVTYATSTLATDSSSTTWTYATSALTEATNTDAFATGTDTSAAGSGTTAFTLLN